MAQETRPWRPDSTSQILNWLDRWIHIWPLAVGGGVGLILLLIWAGGQVIGGK
jgi:hypothetical protein